MIDFFRFTFADFIGIGLSIATIITASKIPEAIMTYRVKRDIKRQIVFITTSINKLRNKGDCTKEDLVTKFNQIDCYFSQFIPYVDKKINKKFQRLHQKYIKMVETDINESSDNGQNLQSIDKIQLILLMDEYKVLVDEIKYRIGDFNEQEEEQLIQQFEPFEQEEQLSEQQSIQNETN